LPDGHRLPRVRYCGEHDDLQSGEHDPAARHAVPGRRSAW
jgi:hypothetical protein